MQILPLFGRGIRGKSLNVSAQRRINLYAEQSPDAEKTDIVYYPRPGLVRGFTDPPSVSSTTGGPVRGLLVVQPLGAGGFAFGQEFVYGIQEKHSILAITSSRFLTSDDFLLTENGPVQMAVNGLGQIIAVDGKTGYDVNNATTLAAALTFPDGARSVIYYANRFFCDDPSANGKFRWSGVEDMFDWDPTNFAAAESEPDPLVQVYLTRGELVLFGKRTIEWWQTTGTSTVVERVGGSGINWGCMVYNSPRTIGDNVFFIGRTGTGQAQVVVLSGHQAQPVSTPDVEKTLNDAIDSGIIPQTSAVTWSGHQFYLVHLTDTSLAFNVTTGEWDEWQTQDSFGMPHRFCGQYVQPYRGTGLITDSRDGRVYYLDDDVFLDDDIHIVRELTTRHLFQNFDRFTVNKLFLDLETGSKSINDGGGAALRAPRMSLQISHNNGHTWGNPMWVDCGKLGEYVKTAQWRRLGRSRDFTFRFRTTDDFRSIFINCALVIDG